MGIIARGARCRSYQGAAENPACDDQEGDRRHRVSLISYRHLTDDDFRERVYYCPNDTDLGNATLSCLAQSFRAPFEFRALGKVEVAWSNHGTAMAGLRRKIPGRRRSRTRDAGEWESARPNEDVDPGERRGPR